MATSKIDIDFQRMKQQAEQLEEIANEMDELAKSELNGSIEQISKNWKGENASSYIAKADLLKSNVSTTATRIKNLSERVLARAQHIYEIEKRNEELAKMRKY